MLLNPVSMKTGEDQVKLFGKGFTMGGVFLPAFFTVLGIFWLFVASRAKGSEDSCKANSGTDT